jgi:DNA repair exonuclease SbcCD ATPase subunit
LDVGAVKIPQVPRSPEARVAEELAQLRARALQAREFSAEELGQVRAAEANFARTREQKYAQEAQRVRQQRDSRAAEAARFYQQREAEVARVEVQQSMRQEYLAELDPYHRALESETLRQAELGYARGEIVRLESLESRLVALEARGVDRVSLVPPDERNARMDAELREFQRAVDAPDERNARMDAELREFQRAVDAPDERNARMDAELREFQRAVDAPDERNARLDADLESLRRSIDGLEVERDGLESGRAGVGEDRMPEPEPQLERADGVDVSDNSIELSAG